MKQLESVLHPLHSNAISKQNFNAFNGESRGRGRLASRHEPYHLIIKAYIRNLSSSFRKSSIITTSLWRPESNIWGR